MDDIQFQKSYSALLNPGFVAPAGKTGGGARTGKSEGEAAAKGGFAGLLQKTIAEKQQQLVFSKHALRRMDSRGIQMTQQLLSRMNAAVQDAAEKGIRDALMINGQTAFIVNVPSRTVVTTMSGSEMQNNVFTNIDGAVVL